MVFNSVAYFGHILLYWQSIRNDQPLMFTAGIAASRFTLTLNDLKGSLSCRSRISVTLQSIPLRPPLPVMFNSSLHSEILNGIYSRGIHKKYTRTYNARAQPFYCLVTFSLPLLSSLSMVRTNPHGHDVPNTEGHPRWQCAKKISDLTPLRLDNTPFFIQCDYIW